MGSFTELAVMNNIQIRSSVDLGSSRRADMSGTTLQPTTRQNPGCTQRRGMWRVDGGGGGDAMPLDGYFRWRTSVFAFASLFHSTSGHRAPIWDSHGQYSR